MTKTLNQRIYETPADVKKAGHDSGYEEGRCAVQITEELKNELGNAIAAYGRILGAAALGATVQLGFEKLRDCTIEELRHKMQILKDFYETLIKNDESK